MVQRVPQQINPQPFCSHEQLLLLLLEASHINLSRFNINLEHLITGGGTVLHQSQLDVPVYELFSKLAVIIFDTSLKGKSQIDV